MTFSSPANAPQSPGPSAGCGRLILETLTVGSLGIILALASNALSPRGLTLGRDYFPPRNAHINPPDSTQTEASSPPSPTPAQAASPPVHEFRVVTREKVVAMTQDPKYVTRKWLLIDARKADAHRAGHIPGSLQFDRFQPGQNLASVLPACLAAETIVIYCNGGSCEDSYYAARMLRDFGVPSDRLAIYEGGFFEWSAAARAKATTAP